MQSLSAASLICRVAMMSMKTCGSSSYCTRAWLLLGDGQYWILSDQLRLDPSAPRYLRWRARGNTMRYEDLRHVVLIGHSYGGMVATSVVDRAGERIAQLIYLDAFVPRNGQALVDLLPPERRRSTQDSIKAGDGWRVTAQSGPARYVRSGRAMVRRSSPAT